MAGEQTLAQIVKTKYPQQYGKIDDVELEEMILKKYPQQYGHLPRTKPTTAPAAKSEPSLTDQAGSFAKDVIKGGGKQIKDIIMSIPQLAQQAAENPPVIGGILRAARTGKKEDILPGFGTARDLTEMLQGMKGKSLGTTLAEGQEQLTGVKLAGDQPVGEKVGATAVNLALLLAGLKGPKMVRQARGRFRTTPGGGFRDPLKPGLTQEEFATRFKEPMSAEDLGNLAESVGNISEQSTGNVQRPNPQSLRPRLVGRGDQARPGPRTDRAIRQAIEEPIDPKRIQAEKRRAGGRLGQRSPTASEQFAAALEEIRQQRDLPERVDLPPSDLPPMPKTGAREAPLPPGRTLAEPGGALGLGEESAAAGRRSLMRNQRRKTAEEGVAETPQSRKAARDAEIDDLADSAEKAALGISDEAPRPGSVQFVSYERGATPAQAAATAAEQRAAESAAVRNVPRESLVVEGAAPGATAGKSKLPPLNKPRKAVGQPASSALPERKTVSTEIKAQDSFKKLMGTIRKLETGDSRVDQRARRIVYLGSLEKPTAAQAAEMAAIQRELLAHPKVPDVLKTRWKKVVAALEQSKRPATRAAEAIAAKDQLPTKANGDTRPLTQRGEDVAKKIDSIRKSEADKIRSNMQILADQARKMGLTKKAEEIEAKAGISKTAPAAPTPETATPGKGGVATVPPEASAAAVAENLPEPRPTTPEPAPAKAEAAPEAVSPSAGRPAGPPGLASSLERSRRALPFVQQAIEETVGREFGEGPLERDVTPATEFVGGRAAQVAGEFGSGTGYRPGVPSRPSVRIPEGFKGPTAKMMKQSSIVRKAQDLKSKSLKSYKSKPVPKEVMTRMADAEIPTVAKPEETIRKAQTIREQRFREQAAGPAPKGVEPLEWQRLNAVENEARGLVEQGIHDPRLLKELVDYWGAHETASRVGLTDYMSKEAAANYLKDLTNTKPRQRPVRQAIAEMEARYRHLLDDPRGFMRVEALAAGGGALAGGLAGATIDGEDITDRISYALSGALIGGSLGFAGIRGVQMAARATGLRNNTKAYAETLDSANLLASPAALKASFGSMGGVAHGLWEKLYTGDMAGLKRGIRATREAPKIYLKTLLGPTKNLRKLNQLTQQIANQPGLKGLPEKVLLNVLRPFIAADRAATHILRSAGFSAAEAERLLLMGEPTTWQGQALLKGVNSSFFARMMMKFPRVRIGALERAAEFTSGFSGRLNTRPTKGHPSFSGFKPQERLSKKQLRARAIFGGAMMAGYSAYGYTMDPSLGASAVATSMAGPAQIPAAVGVALGKALRRGTTGAPLAVALAEPVAASVPQISESDIRMLPERFVPGAPLTRALRRFGILDE